ncbi:MAG: hypothetical protein WBA54_04785, partial [Acidaminobacteraceae bacterium]
MKKLKKITSLLLIITMLISIVDFSNISFSADSIETNVSKLIKDMSDSDAKSTIEQYYGDFYLSKDKSREISLNILKLYRLVAYIEPSKNTGSYRGSGQLKNNEYRYFGTTYDGQGTVTNPYFDNDANSGKDLRLKDWQLFNENLATFKDTADVQDKHLFFSELYDPVNKLPRKLLLAGSSVNMSQILKSKVPSSEIIKLMEYSQVGSIPTINNEGSIMIQHLSDSGILYYDSFVVEPLDLGDTYKTEVKAIYPDGGKYKFVKDEDELDIEVMVYTTIDFASPLANVNEVFIQKEQKIELNEKLQGATYQNSEEKQHKVLESRFQITLFRKDFTVGEENNYELEATAHLKSKFGDEIKVIGNGFIKVELEPNDVEADFDIFHEKKAVTESVFAIGKDVIKLKDDESPYQTIERLSLKADLTLKPLISFNGETVNSVAYQNWLIWNYDISGFEYFSNEKGDIVKKLDKTNMNKYIGEDGTITFKLFVRDDYDATFEVIHSTSLKIDYKGVPLIPVNRPPNANVTSKDYMKAGTTTSFSGLKSYDTDGYITNYDFNGYGGFRTINLNDEGTGGYGTPLMIGDATIRLTVTDDSNLSGTDNKNIRVISPIEHNEVLRGVHKVNRKITLDSRLDSGTTYYPSSLFETSWTIDPVDGQSRDSIKWDTDNQGNLVDVLFKEEGIYKIKKTVKAKCTYPNDEELIITETIERGIRIYPDEKPVAKFALVKYNLRQLLDSGYSTIKVYDTSYSPDMDKIYKRTWWYRYDANNDGNFDDEVYQLIDSVNDKKEIALRVLDVGRYEFKLSIEEDYTEDTITRFLTPSDIHKDNTEDMEKYQRFAEVLNVAPVVKLEERANKKIEMILLTDYEGSDRANLESEIALLSKSMQEKKLNLISNNISIHDEGNSSIIGQREVPVFEYYRNVSLSMYYDSYYNEKFYGDYSTTRTYPGILSYSQRLETAHKTEKDAKLLPSYPLAYTTNHYQGYSYSTDSSSSNFRRMRGGSLDVYDEASVKRATIKFSQVLNIFVNSRWGNSGVADYNSWSFYGGTMRRMVGYVDKEFKKGSQVSIKLENINSFNLDKVKNLELDISSDKYIVILTKKYDSVKSIDETFLKYLKDNNFKVRYSIPDLSGVSDVEKTAKIILNNENKDKIFLNIDSLIYNPECSSFTDYKSVLSSISLDYSNYSTDETIYKLLGETLEFDTFYFDYEGDPLQDTKYDYTHEEVFDNSMGLDLINNTSTKELLKSYSKVGKYVINPRYQDNPKNSLSFNNYWLWNRDNTKINLIVHRKPVALARFTSKTINANTYEISLKDDESYDIDHTSLTSKGIIEWSWFVRDADTLDTRIYSGKNITITKDKSKRLKVGLKVKDLEGQWSDYAYLDIDNIPKPKIKLEFDIKALDENFSISSLPARESIDIYNVKTVHLNPVILETYIEDADGARTLLSRYESEQLTSGSGDVIGVLKEDGESIEWTNTIYKTLKKYKDGNYNIILKAIDKSYT